MVRRITLLFGAGLVAVGMVTVVPASASPAVSSRVPPAQVLGQLTLAGRTTAANPTAGFAEGTTSSGHAAAFTDEGAKSFGEGGASTRPSALLAPFTQMPGNSHQFAWFIFNVGADISGANIQNQGYLAAPGENVEFGSIAVTAAGNGLISFTVSGPDFFPTSAFALIDGGGAGPVQVAALGQSPQDGFTEYRRLGTPRYRPRWGDYSMAVTVGSRFIFSSEYIQSENCTDDDYALDPTCGGTRSRSANWGTSVNALAAAA